MRAKFRVNRIEEHEGTQPSKTFHLVAVSGPTNKTWSQWTPDGVISIKITNPEALDHLKIGQHYFVDFSPAPATEAAEGR